MAKGLEITVEITPRKTVWFYILRLALFLKVRSMYSKLSDKSLVNLYIDGKIYSSIKLNQMDINARP